MASSFLLSRLFAICLLNMEAVTSLSSFLPTTPGREWRMVSHLNMTDPTERCPNSWQRFTSPRSMCGKKTTAPCDSWSISTSGASFYAVCGRFRGYQMGTPDGFNEYQFDIETGYVDGISITYGSPGNRHHVYTYAVGYYEQRYTYSCPCAGGIRSLVGSNYYCESGNPGPSQNNYVWYPSDVLWDGQQCGGDEGSCCNSPDLPWFNRTFSKPISENLEVRICTDQELSNENVGIESFELYIQVNTSMATTSSPVNMPLAYTSSPVNVPVATTSSPVNVPVATTSSPVNVPVASTSSPINMPLASTSSPVNVPLASTSSPINVLLASTSSPVNKPLAYTSSPVNIPVATTSSPANVPVASTSSPVNVPLASIDIDAVVGINTVTSFVVFFPLGVLVASCICCVVKRRSKVALHHPAIIPSPHYNGTKKAVSDTDIAMETNLGYAVPAKLPDDYIYIN